MASNNNNNDRANNSAHASSTRGPPKVQFSLQNILLNSISATPQNQVRPVHVNSSEKEESSAIASPSSTTLSVSNVVSEYAYAPNPMGYCFLDLNLPPPPETDPPSPALHDAEKVQECNLQCPKENNISILEDEIFETEMERNGVLCNDLERAAESEERTMIEEVSEREESKSGIRFGALLDAVECATEEYGSKPSEPNQAEESKRRRVKWKRGGEEEEEGVVEKVAQEVSTSPVVKSNRGRTQVLPYKYRDSVIEPLTHLSSRPSRSSPNNGPTKRKPR